MEMKDMIVIKNLPSNIVEEAWVVIKPEVRNKEKELIKRIKNSKTNTKAENGYVLKEAETVIYDYLKNINSYEDKKKYNDIIRKYNKLKNALQIVSVQKAETENELNYIDSIIFEIELASSTKEIQEILDEISENLIKNKVEELKILDQENLKKYLK